MPSSQGQEGVMSELHNIAVLWGALPVLMIFWALPLVDVSCSRQVSGVEKCIWIAACALTSWLAWVAFYLLAPVSRAKR